MPAALTTPLGSPGTGAARRGAVLPPLDGGRIACPVCERGFPLCDWQAHKGGRKHAQKAAERGRDVEEVNREAEFAEQRRRGPASPAPAPAHRAALCEWVVAPPAGVYSVAWRRSPEMGDKVPADEEVFVRRGAVVAAAATGAPGLLVLCEKGLYLPAKWLRRVDDDGAGSGGTDERRSEASPTTSPSSDHSGAAPLQLGEAAARGAGAAVPPGRPRTGRAPPSAHPYPVSSVVAAISVRRSPGTAGSPPGASRAAARPAKSVVRWAPRVEDCEYALFVTYPVPDWMLNGRKVVETRGYDLQHRFRDCNIAIVECPGGKRRGGKLLVGVLRFGKSWRYATKEDFEDDEARHCVDPVSQFAWGSTKQKWGWEVSAIARTGPTPVPAGMVHEWQSFHRLPW